MIKIITELGIVILLIGALAKGLEQKCNPKSSARAMITVVKLFSFSSLPFPFSDTTTSHLTASPPCHKHASNGK